MRSPPMKRPPQIVGNIGLYYVCFKLSEVRLTLENLEARAPKEFPRGKPIAISCAGVSFADCAASLKVLQGLAFNEVKIIL